MKDRAHKQRLGVFGASGLTAAEDRRLELLMILVGRRATTAHWEVNGANEDGTPRRLLSAPLDVVQVGVARSQEDRLRVDVSGAPTHWLPGVSAVQRRSFRERLREAVHPSLFDTTDGLAPWRRKVGELFR